MAKPEVAIAIIPSQDHFLMQLRDDVPGIAAPGQWGFFGGHLEPGEDPATALKRELYEEIRYTLTSPPVKFGEYPDQHVQRHIFVCPLTVPLDQLVLQEGWDLGLVSPAAIQQGEQYSPVAQEVRPLSVLHRQILLDFMESQRS
jgi:8-oxo-dGTP pyrophosphatase MutT (NUDIX family)